MSGTEGGYFLTEQGGEPAGEGRFVSLEAIEPLRFKDGLTFRPVLGDNVLVNHVSYEPNVEAPAHVHVEEQIVLVLEGELRFWIAGLEPRTMRPGDMAVIPSWVEHRALSGPNGCRQLDVFQPPRMQLLAALKAEPGERGAPPSPPV
jgi:quercetin dioxygenase-like cupin family protein